MPDELFRGEIGADAAAARGLRRRRLLPPARRGARARELERLVEETVAAEGQRVVAWRDVPSTTPTSATPRARSRRVIRQVVVAASDELAGDQDAFERKLYVIRRVCELAAGEELVFPSLLVADADLQGDADRAAAAAATSPTCATRA